MPFKVQYKTKRKQKFANFATISTIQNYFTIFSIFDTAFSKYLFCHYESFETKQLSLNLNL